MVRNLSYVEHFAYGAHVAFTVPYPLPVVKILQKIPRYLPNAQQELFPKLKRATLRFRIPYRPTDHSISRRVIDAYSADASTFAAAGNCFLGGVQLLYLDRLDITAKTDLVLPLNSLGMQKLEEVRVTWEKTPTDRLASLLRTQASLKTVRIELQPRWKQPVFGPGLLRTQLDSSFVSRLLDGFRSIQERYHTNVQSVVVYDGDGKRKAELR